MDDLQMLADLLAKPGPAAEVTDRGRYQLEQKARGSFRHRPGHHGPVRHNLVRRWPGGWLTGGLGLTAAAAAIAFVAASIATAPAAPPRRPPAAVHPRTAVHPPDIARMSGKQILLAAATAAAAAPEGSGTYWHEKVTYSWHTPRTQETWVGHDGTLYLLVGQQVWPLGPGGFPVAAANLTLAQLDRLPTSPAALTAWITRSLMGPQAEIPPGVLPGEVAASLSYLLFEVPAPPAVRAAAYRELASRADVKRLGAVDGGQGLLLTSGGDTPPATGGKLPAGDIRLVINPATLQVTSFTTSQGTETIITQDWTNQIPPILGPPSKPKQAHPGKS
jgi:hypothetical protein